MKIEVFEDPKPAEPTLRLKLEQSGDDVSLAAVDEHGVARPGGYILMITDRGIIMCSSATEVPLPRDERNRVKIINA